MVGRHFNSFSHALRHLGSKTKSHLGLEAAESFTVYVTKQQPPPGIMARCPKFGLMGQPLQPPLMDIVQLSSKRLSKLPNTILVH
ncbi:hypothetical protein RRG08_038576 [Elysia crispata]|uniref:Uncharacterized protein n=1 Tax=Elysia crispata TaxID=231223 RepID=A0AAE1CXW2_9GAST|nr:hypothetical protein RRG08_038576 [Elysia crispata]